MKQNIDQTDCVDRNILLNAMRLEKYMSRAYHPFASKRNRTERKRGSRKVTSHYLQQVFAELHRQPEKLQLIAQNMQHYKQQIYLKRGFLKAIERLEWIFDEQPSVELVEELVFEDSYSGQRLRSYPLLFKGIINT